MRKLIYMSDSFAKKLKQKAQEKGLSISAYIRMVLIEKWEGEEK